jgi:hypothetical protein
MIIITDFWYYFILICRFSKSLFLGWGPDERSVAVRAIYMDSFSALTKKNIDCICILLSNPGLHFPLG